MAVVGLEFPRGANPKGGNANLLLLPFVLENFIKLKNLNREGAHVPNTPSYIRQWMSCIGVIHMDTCNNMCYNNIATEGVSYDCVKDKKIVDVVLLWTALK